MFTTPKELDRQFKQEKSNFKIAIVVDMWLTGFDVPLLDTMYIDKPVKQHNLIQTISRVNRKFGDKEKGLVVDYIGIKRQMNLALKKYSKGEKKNFEEIMQSVVVVKDHLDLLAKLFHKFDASLYFNGSPLEQLDCLNRASEYVQITHKMEQRFMFMMQRLKAAYDICCGSEDLSQAERDHIHFYLAVRSIVFKLTKGNAPDTAQMNARVREMIKEALQSDGVQEIFKLSEDGSEVDIFDEDYLKKIDKIKLPNTKIKLLQQLLTKAIEDFKKVNKIKGIDFSKKFKALVEQYNERKERDVLTSEVLEDFTDEIIDLFYALKKEKESFSDLGIDFEEKAFYDILKALAHKYDFEYPEDKLLVLAKEVKTVVDDKAKYTDWSRRDDIKAELKVGLIILLAEHGYPPVDRDEVYKEIFEQAENFKKYQAKPNQNQMQEAELALESTSLLDHRVPRDRLYAFTLSVEKIETEVVLELDAVPTRQIIDLPQDEEGLMQGLSKIETFSVQIRLSRDDFLRLEKTQPRQDNEEWWWSLELADRGPAEATVYEINTDSALGPARALLRMLPEDESKLVRARIKLPAAASHKEIEVALTPNVPTDGTFVAVYNVGQGLASAICDIHTSSPLMYFDFGCGEGRHRYTAPTEMRFCFANNPSILLSHWHTDHYMAADLLDPRAKDQMWIGPEQSPPATGARFAAQLMLKNRLLIWPRTLSSVSTPFGDMVMCKGNALNTSGLAMLALVGDAAGPIARILMPGDAGYTHIPGTQGTKIDALVASHHGGAAAGTPPSPTNRDAPFVLSYGKNNTYPHPATSALNKLKTSGWRRDIRTVNGHAGVGLLKNPPQLGCDGKQCDLKMVQI